jgi:Putative polyhydroxyalkanoic acid system protein (PHA_gran_rgn)
MSSLDFSIPHKLTQEEALKRIKNLLNDAKRDHANLISNLQENWEGNKGTFSFSAKGYDVSGELIVHPNSIDIHSKVPFALTLFKGMITGMITQKANELLS